MLALNVFAVNVDPVVVPMTRVPLWVQVHGLPYSFRTENEAKTLAGGFAGFIDWIGGEVGSASVLDFG